MKVIAKSQARSADEAKARAERLALRELRALKSEMKATSDRLRSIETSRIWLITLPLRKLGSHLPMAARRAIRRAANLTYRTTSVLHQANTQVEGVASSVLTQDETSQALSADEAKARAEGPALRELRALKSEMKATADRVRSIEASTIWLITLPLRKLGSHLSMATRRAVLRPANLTHRNTSVLHQTNTQVEGVASAQDETFALPLPQSPRVLIIDSRWPRPDQDSGSLDAVIRINALRDLGWEVIFAAEECSAGFDYRRRLEGEGIICLSPAVSPSIETFLQTDGKTLDLCILSRVDSAGRFFEAVWQNAAQARFIFNPVDLHYLRAEREAAISDDETAMRAVDALRERELYMVSHADATIVVSSLERTLLEVAVPGAMVFEMPLARPVRAPSQIPGFEQRKGVGFVGGFQHKPNVDAIEYFLREIWPEVHNRLPDLRLSIAGSDLPQKVLSDLPPNVDYAGHLPSLDPWLDGLRLTVAPLRYGAGAKGKIVSSLAAGVPCVGTPIAVEGMQLNDGLDIAVCDTPETFAARVCELHEDAAPWARLSSGGQRKARHDFTIEADKERLASLLHALDLPSPIHVGSRLPRDRANKTTPAFFGHHKCATQFIGGVARDFCRALNLNFVTVNKPKCFGYNLRSHVERQIPDFLNCMNAKPGYVTSLPHCVAFHVIRDPRDIAVSAYFSHLTSHHTKGWPELVEHRAKLARLNLEDGLLLDIEFTDRLPTEGYDFAVFKTIDEWDYDQPNMLELKFEEIVIDPQRTLAAAFAFLGLLSDIKHDRRSVLRQAIANNVFEKVSGGRVAGDENVAHHYRKGVPGDWRNYFSRQHKEWFKDKYPSLLTKTGYESNSSW